MGFASHIFGILTALLIVGAGYAAVLSYHINTAEAALPEVAEAPSAAEVTAAANRDAPLEEGDAPEAPPE